MMSESDCTSTVKRCEDSKSSIRKNNKPLMEKRRRARINSCLGNLKTLVLQALKKDNAQYSKLEKADILEMTVKHLRAVQRQQMTAAMVTDPNVVTKYRTGFNECAGEVMRYLSSVQGVSDETRTRVLTHLGGCLQTVNSPPVPVMDPMRGALPPHVVSGMPVPHPAYVTSGCPSYHSGQKYFNSASHSVQDNQLFPCITGSVHLIPSTLPSGQMALVLAPQMQAVPLYVAPSGQPTPAVKASPSDRSTCSSSNCGSSPQTPVEPPILRPSRSDACPRSLSSPDCDQAVLSIKEEDVWRPW